MKIHSKPFLNIFTLFALLVSLLGSAIIVTPAYAAAFLVTKVADTNDGVCDADCSLREAIAAANANGAGSDTLTLPAGIYTLTLGSQLPPVATTLIINGGGVAATIVQANAVTRTATYRIFEVSSGGDLTLNNLTVRNGQCLGACATLTASGGGILSQGTLSVTNSAVSGNATNVNGGGIYSSGTLTITNSTISGNVTNQNGAGIFSSGPMTVTKSTFSGNFVTQNGGGIHNSGDLTVTNSTFSGNSAGGRGGGIHNTTGTLAVTNSTFSGNWADIEGGGVSRVSGTVTLKNTIIANSPSGHGANCGNTLPGTLTADSKNISDDSSCASATISVTTNLGALLLNGGSTLNFALLAGSSAIDTGDNSVCPATDQRDIARFQGLACDIGAYEFQGTTALLTVAPATGTYGGTVNLTATFESGASGISGRIINFTLNGSGVGSAVTNGSGVATLGNVSLLGINAGTYPAGAGSGVGASFAGDATYNASSVNATLTVTQAALTVTANNKTRAYGAANPAFDAALTGFVNGEVLATSAVTGTPSCSSTATSASPVSGSPYTITCVINTLTSSNYSFAFVSGQLTVNKATLTVIADNQNIIFGDPDPAFTFTYSAFVPGDTFADIDTPPTCTVSGLHANAGTYPIVCSSGTDNNYAFSYVNGTLSIGLVSQTITITTPAPGTALFPGSSFTVAATASSGLPVTYSASGACTNVGATFSMNANAPGICTVLYDQAGNSNYGPAPQLSETANIALVIITNGINSNADTGDGHVDELEVTSAGITHLTVTFNKAADNPAGDTDIDDVTHPANYMLVADNGDGIQTSACNVGVTGGDLVIPVNAVTYNNNGGSGPFVATLNLNGGIALPIGNYRLIVCGTTSVVDLTSIPLAGNGLASGTDFIRNFSVTNAPPNTAARIPATGFPQNKITVLPSHPADKAYAATDLWVEIPKLGVKMSIVGVPQTKDGWDVTWLDKNAGWLNGSAFPTWQGNSVITAHVWDALNKPGPFANLKNLKYGDQIKIHAFGQVFTYELRASALISPTNTSAMLKHEEKSWLTLITCEDYQELTQKYSYRRMVRAVLVSVTTEK